MASEARKLRRQRELIRAGQEAQVTVSTLQDRIRRLEQDNEFIKERLQECQKDLDHERGLVDFERKEVGKLKVELSEMEVQLRQMESAYGEKVGDKLRLTKELKEAQARIEGLEKLIRENGGETVKGMRRRLQKKQEELAKMQLECSKLKRKIVISDI